MGSAFSSTTHKALEGNDPSLDRLDVRDVAMSERDCRKLGESLRNNRYACMHACIYCVFTCDTLIE